MASKWEGIRCKSFTFPGINGAELVIAETIDRLSIEVTVKQAGAPNITDSLIVRLNAEQFKSLCGLDSYSDGLEVLSPRPEPAPAIEPAPPFSACDLRE
jgi:hypothetical protein